MASAEQLIWRKIKAESVTMLLEVRTVTLSFLWRWFPRNEYLYCFYTLTVAGDVTFFTDHRDHGITLSAR